MNDGIRLDPEQVSGLARRLRARAEDRAELATTTGLSGVGPGVADDVAAAADTWRGELGTAADALRELAGALDDAVGALAATDADVARAARGRREAR